MKNITGFLLLTALLLMPFKGFAGDTTSACVKISGIINKYAAVNFIHPNKTRFSVVDAAGFKKDDQILFIQMQGAKIDTSNTPDYGKVIDVAGAGDYEFAIIENVSNNTISLTQPLKGEKYDVDGKIQIVTVPQYNRAIIIDTLTCAPWNGETGGILALLANCLALDENIDVSGKGFRGGAYRNDPCDPDTNSGIYVTDSPCFAEKGEGIAGFGVGNKTRGRGAVANGGGGGNSHNGGGGGGSNAGKGGKGGYGYQFKPNAKEAAGLGGSFTHYSTFEAKKLFMGGGGGAGQANNGHGSGGGNGGGIIFIKAGKIDYGGGNINTNTWIDASGKWGGIDKDSLNPDGVGGGGAGGTIILDANINMFGLVRAQGGIGGMRTGSKVGHGTGGGGGGGWILLSDLSSGQVFNDGGIMRGIVYSAPEGGTYGATAGEDGKYFQPEFGLEFTGVLKSIDSTGCKNCYPQISTFDSPCQPWTFKIIGDPFTLKSFTVNTNNVRVELSDSFPTKSLLVTLSLIDTTRRGDYTGEFTNIENNAQVFGGTIFPVPHPVLTANGRELTATLNDPYNGIDWYFNDEKTNQRGTTFNADKSGEYYFVETNMNKCAIPSNKVVVIISDIKEQTIADEYFALYPNPANDKLTLTSKSDNAAQVSVELHTILSETVFKNIYPAASGFTATLPMDNLPSGIYFVHVSSGTFKKVYKISKQ